MSAPLLDVSDLRVSIAEPGSPAIPILNDIAFTLDRGATLGIVGESGSGKSLLALGLIGLLPGSAAAAGSIRFDGRNLLDLSEAEFCRIRGARIGMIFQEPMTALNPAMRVGDQVAEGLVWHRGVSWRAARREALALLDRVRIAEAARRFDSFPHELSGGQRQRVGIAVALIVEPDLLIADEPTTALDVTVQAEILAILAELVSERRMALILISHDLGVVARTTESIMVLYAGTRVEAGLTRDVLRAPQSPYTQGLLAALPKRPAGTGRLATIPGTVPRFTALPPGCRFGPRCPAWIAPCDAAEPTWRVLDDGRGVRCIRAGLPADAAVATATREAAG